MLLDLILHLQYLWNRQSPVEKVIFVGCLLFLSFVALLAAAVLTVSGGKLV